MNPSLYVAATGMHAQQLNVETISNNLANTATTGYKAARVNFGEMMYQGPDGIAGNANVTRNPLGLGVNVNSVTKNFSTGDLKQTESALDVAIDGQGFFEIIMPDGSRAYTRGGSLQINSDSLLTTAEGYPFASSVRVPSDSIELTITPDGKVMSRTANQQTAMEIGQIEMVNFTNPSGLKLLDNGKYLPTKESGDVIFGKPGEDGLGKIAQKRLEGSNVKLVDEMVNLMLAQRAYELNSKAVQVSDELMAMTNNLRR